MADSDSTLEILIKLLAETQGADAVQSALNKTKDATGDVGAATEKLTGQTVEGRKEGEKFELSHRAIHQILHLIGHESGPAAGAALGGLAAAGGLGGIGAVVFAVKELFEWLNKIKEKAKEVAEQNAEVWIKQRDAIEDAADSAKKFHEALDKAKEKTNELKSAFELENAVLVAQIEGHKKILEALEKEQLAEAKGDKSKEESIRQRFENLKREYDIIAEQKKLQEERNQLAGLNQRQGKLSDTAEDVKSELGRVKASAEAAAASGRMEGKDEKKLIAAAEAAQKDFLAAEPFGGTQVRVRREDYKKASAALEAYEADAEIVREHEGKLALLNSKLDEATKARDENTSAIQTQKNKVQTSQAILNEHERTNTAERAISAIGKIGGAEKLSGQFEQAALHKQASPALQQLLQSLGFSNAQIIGMIKALADSQSNHAAHIRELKNYVDASIARLNRATQ